MEALTGIEPALSSWEAESRTFTGNALGQARRKAGRSIGLEQFHVHDVRHAGLTMAAQGGATTRGPIARRALHSARGAHLPACRGGAKRRHRDNA